MTRIGRRAIAAAAAAAIALTAFGSAPASAGTRRGDAVAAAAIVGVFGTVAALIAAKAERDRHRAYYGPHYATPYYGAPGHYAPYHRGPQWRGWHRRHWHR